MLLILYSISGVNSRNGGKMVRKKMVEKWIFNGFHFDKGRPYDWFFGTLNMIIAAQ